MRHVFTTKLLFLAGFFLLDAAALAETNYAQQVYVANKLGIGANSCAAIVLTPCDYPRLSSELTSVNFELAKRAVYGSLLLSYSEPAGANKRSLLLGARLRWPKLAPHLSLSAGIGSHDNDTTDLRSANRRYSLGLSYDKGRLGFGLGLDNDLGLGVAAPSVRVTLIYSLGR